MNKPENFSDIETLMTTYKAWKREYYSAHTKCELLEKKTTFCEEQINSTNNENALLIADLKRIRSLVKLQQSNLKNLCYLQDENKALAVKLKGKNEELIGLQKKLDSVVQEFDRTIMDLKISNEENLKDLEIKLKFEDKEQLDEMVDLICLKEETIQSLENELKELKNKNEEETFKLTLEIENYKRNARLVSDKEPDLQQENQIIRLKEYFKNKLMNQKTEYGREINALQQEIANLEERLKKAEMEAKIEDTYAKQNEKLRAVYKKSKAKQQKLVTYPHPKNLGPKGMTQSVTSSIIQLTRKRKLFKPENNFM